MTDCTRCGTAIADEDPRATLDVEYVEPTSGNMETSAYVLCPDCYGDLETFLE